MYSPFGTCKLRLRATWERPRGEASLPDQSKWSSLNPVTVRFKKLKFSATFQSIHEETVNILSMFSQYSVNIHIKIRDFRGFTKEIVLMYHDYHDYEQM